MINSYFFNHKLSCGDIFIGSDLLFAKRFFINNISKMEIENGSIEIQSPFMMKKDVWKKTGHYDHYLNNMFEFENCCLKPMSCPGAVFFVQKMFNKTFNNFPIKIFEWGKVYRKEPSGTLFSLRRLNSFIQDDSHIFCIDAHQATLEIKKLLYGFCFFYNHILKWNFYVVLSTRPEKSVDDNNAWNVSTDLIKNILFEAKKENVISEYKIEEGEGAFYGPKIDFVFETKSKKSKSLGLQLGTIQVDFFLSKKLNLYFNKEIYPIIVHSAMLGSIERFLSILLEKSNDKLPFWCSPISLLFFEIGEKRKNDNRDKLFSCLLDAQMKFKYFSGKYDINSILKQYSNVPMIIFYGDIEDKQKVWSIRGSSANLATRNQIDIVNDITNVVGTIKKFFCY